MTLNSTILTCINVIRLAESLRAQLSSHLFPALMALISPIPRAHTIGASIPSRCFRSLTFLYNWKLQSAKGAEAHNG